MPGAKRRALKKLLSPNHTPTAADGAPISVDNVNAAPPASLPDEAVAAASNPDSYVSPGEENNIIETMQAREGAIGKATSPVSSPPPDKTKPIAVTADQLAGGTAGGGKKKSSKQRFLEREARKKEQLVAQAAPTDAANDAKLEREKREEEEVITKTCKELGVQIHEVPPDGHCMYYAIADQLAILGLMSPQDAATPQTTRSAAAAYLRAHADSFMPFVPSVLGEDMEGATDDGVMTPEGYNEYCRRVEESGDWGGEIEIQALARHYNVPIHVIQRGPPAIISHTAEDDTGSGALTAAQSLQAGKAVRISYHHRMYGLGEHYNSLRPVQRR